MGVNPLDYYQGFPLGFPPGLGGEVLSPGGVPGVPVQPAVQAPPPPHQPIPLPQMPQVQDLGGRQSGTPAWVRHPFFPTAPFYSTRADIGYTTRYYTAILLPTDADFVVGTEAIRRVQFDIPCRLIAINAGTRLTNGAAFPVGWHRLDTFLFRLEHTQGDRLHINAVLGSAVCGSAERPGEVGGVGWTVNTGATLIVGITPLLANLQVTVALQCLEMRGPSNYVRG